MTQSTETHACHFCGTEVYRVQGTSLECGTNERHNLSDCRPDLVKHEIGDTCTWSYRREYFEKPDKQGQTYKEEHCCYAYQDSDMKWTKEHIHFYKDGPM